MNNSFYLLSGSARVDQWRQEINTVFSTVLGFLRPEDWDSLNLLEETLLYRTLYGKWTIQGSPPFNKEHKIFVRYYQHWRGKSPQEGYTLICSLGEFISYDKVRLVRRDLDEFVEGMEKMFSSLRERMQPLYEAAFAKSTAKMDKEL